MTHRERILAVYRGQTPDVVPFMLDLSHWFYHRHGRPWDLSASFMTPDSELIDYHRSSGVGFYIPNLGSVMDSSYGPNVVAKTEKIQNGQDVEIVWSLETPGGRIWRTRQWSQQTYSWHISRWGVRTQQDIKVLTEALSSLTFRPAVERYQNWVREVGDIGVVYASSSYSAMGQLLNYWMGVEQTMYAVCDWPELVAEAVEAINAALLGAMDALCLLPAEIIIMGDNFSSDLQPPAFFNRWSRAFYAEAVRRIHAAGKCVAVHVDGRLRGLLRVFAELGVDCIDAVTPAPMGDLTGQQCRDEAGPALILSGGVPPTLWLPEVPKETFIRSVMDWLELRKRSPRLIANAGDQVPPGAEEDRIALMRDLVEKHGRY